MAAAPTPDGQESDRVQQARELAMALITAMSMGDEALIPPLLADAVREVPSETIEVLLGCVDALLGGLTEELDIPKAEIIRNLGLTMAAEPEDGPPDDLA
jgi:hypothetical protein